MKPIGFLLVHISPARRLALFIVLLMNCSPGKAQEALVLPVWPGTVPGDYGTIGPERLRAPSEAPTKDAKWTQGGHGFGVRKSAMPCSTWTDRFVAWLQNQWMPGTNVHAK